MRVDFTSQDGQIDPFWTLWMISVIESQEETIFINRITAGSASRVCNTTHLIYQPQSPLSKLWEFHFMVQLTSIHGVLFVSHRFRLRVMKRALPGEAPARSIFKLVSQGGIPNVFKNREDSSFKPQHFPSAKFRITFQRHGGTHHRSRPGAARLRALRSRRRGDLFGRGRFDSDQPTG